MFPKCILLKTHTTSVVWRVHTQQYYFKRKVIMEVEKKPQHVISTHTPSTNWHHPTSLQGCWFPREHLQLLNS